MGRPASLALQLAQALCSESKDVHRDLASMREVKRQWTLTPRRARLFWLRKARRVLQRLEQVGPSRSKF